MKKYEAPEMYVLAVVTEDVLKTSSGSTLTDEDSAKEGENGTFTLDSIGGVDLFQ